MFFLRNEDPESVNKEEAEEIDKFELATLQLQTTTEGPAKKRSRKDKKFEWKDHVVEKLILLWQEQPLLYNVSHPNYHIKEKRRNCINAIVKSLAEDTEVMFSSIKIKDMFLSMQLLFGPPLGLSFYQNC